MLACIYAGPLIGTYLLADVSRTAEPVSIIFSCALGQWLLQYYIVINDKRRCTWSNGYRRRDWTRRHEFKTWTRLIAFHIALIPLGKV